MTRYVPNRDMHTPAHPVAVVSGVSVPGGWAVVWSDGLVVARDIEGKAIFRMLCHKSAERIAGMPVLRGAY